MVTAHLSGEIDVGLYPLLDGDCTGWLAADFHGPAAMLDALAYLKAARAARAPAVLEMSRSGSGAHARLFFTAPVPAASARQVGAGGPDATPLLADLRHLARRSADNCSPIRSNQIADLRACACRFAAVDTDGRRAA